MGSLFSYSIYSAIIMALLYLTYKWVLAGENQHRANRAILLSIYTVSMGAYPMMVWLRSLMAHTSDTAVAATVDIELPIMTMADVTDNPIANILLWIYLIGMLAVAIHTVIIWLRLANIVAHGQHETIGRYTLVLTDRKDIAPFSWRRYIVMNETDYAESGNLILCHETRHLDLHHPIDLMVAQIAAIIEWWNPAAWLMREELKTVHEYQADSCVLAAGVNARDYQMLLIKKAVGARFPSLANSLNHSKLKKRITMMYNQKRSAKRRMRALALLPALGAAVLTANLPAVASVMSEASAAELFSQSAEPTAPASKVTKSSANPADDSKVYDVVEQMPEFPGGMKAMLDYLGANLKYPAGQECAQGRVVVKFVINKDGSVGDTEIIKSLGEAFDAEAVRVVKSMPRFTPGMLNGKPVAVYYVLPVNFKLDKPAKESPKQTNSTTITINKAAADNQSAVNINPMPDNPIVKVNGEEIPYDQLASIPSSSITSMQIDKKSGDRPVILITTK
ncbi:MAG: M56 family metallopeptidase [Candidatus Amulumruptor sp.]